MRETKINKERGKLLLNLKKAMESNCAAEKGLEKILLRKNKQCEF